MGVDGKFGSAYAKSQLGAGQKLTVRGAVFISVKESDKPAALSLATLFSDIGYSIIATRGTSRYLTENGLKNTMINKVSMGRPHVVDAIKNGEVQMVINTGTGNEPRQDGYMIRRAALKFNIPYATTIPGAMAMARGITALKRRKLSVKPLQEYHG